MYVDTFEDYHRWSLYLSPYPKSCYLQSIKRPPSGFLGVFLQAEFTISHFFLTHAQMLGQFEIFLLVIIMLFKSEASSADDLWTPDFLHSGGGQ